MTLLPHESSSALATRLGASAHVTTVISSRALSASTHEVVLAGHAASVAGPPGSDVMVRVSDGAARPLRRRYSVRSFNAAHDNFSLWVTTRHDGAGSQWARNTQPGDHVDVVGPRGKITLDPLADWHLFVGDVSALGAFYRLAESIEPPGRAIFIVEIDDPSDALTTVFDENVAVTGIFVDRGERAPGDPSALLGGLSAFAFPPDHGHAYLFGEFTVSRVLQSALVDRGLSADDISRKAYWRAGRANGERGEPDKDDD